MKDMYLKVENWIAAVHAGEIDTLPEWIKPAIDYHYTSLDEIKQHGQNAVALFDREKAVRGVLKTAEAYKKIYGHEMPLWKQALVYKVFGWTSIDGDLYF